MEAINILFCISDLQLPSTPQKDQKKNLSWQMVLVLCRENLEELKKNYLFGFDKVIKKEEKQLLLQKSDVNLVHEMK